MFVYSLDPFFCELGVYLSQRVAAKFGQRSVAGHEVTTNSLHEVYRVEVPDKLVSGSLSILRVIVGESVRGGWDEGGIHLVTYRSCSQ